MPPVIDVALALALGVGLGVLTGLPLGVVNVAIVEAAVRRGRRSAAGIGVGGAVADLLHAGLAFGGVAGAVVARPALAATLHVVAGVLLLGYAVALARSAARLTIPTATPAPPVPPGPAAFGRAVLTGLALTLPNPAALGAWLAVAAALAPRSTTLGLVTAAGVGAGSALWFVALAGLAARGAARRAVARPWLTRTVAIALATLGVAAIARGVT